MSKAAFCVEKPGLSTYPYVHATSGTNFSTDVKILKRVRDIGWPVRQAADNGWKRLPRACVQGIAPTQGRVLLNISSKETMLSRLTPASSCICITCNFYSKVIVSFDSAPKLATSEVFSDSVKLCV